MLRSIFSVFFIAIPIFSIAGATSLKMLNKGLNFFDAFESSVPTVFFYYLSISICWAIFFHKLKRVAN